MWFVCSFFFFLHTWNLDIFFDFVARISPVQPLPKISSSTWMWNISSMASNSFESKPPGGQSGMDQSNHSMFPSEKFSFIPVLERKFVPGMMSYLMLSLSNTKTFCWLMRLSLLNSGNLRSCIITSSCVLRWPVRVLTSLVSPSNFVITPFGKADLLIIETFKPESKCTRKSLWLLIEPIVLAIQMVMGDSCFGILIFGPWWLNRGASALIS